MNSYFLPLNVHIVFFITLFFIIGIIYAAYAAPLLPLCITIVALGIKMIVQLHKKQTLSLTYLLLTISIIAGYIRYNQQCAPFHNFYSQSTKITCDVQGIITDILPIEHPRANERITLLINRIRITENSWIPARLYIHLYVKFPTSYLISDTVQFNSIVIKKPTSQSFSVYLIKEGITASIFYSGHNHQLLQRPSWCIWRWIYNSRQNIFQRIRRKMTSKIFALFSSLFLGNRSLNKQLTEKTADQFRQWGISHYLARSGLHLTLFSFIWRIALRTIPINFRFKQGLIFLLILTYSLLSWASVSFVRALHSFYLYILCNLLYLRPHFLHNLTLITLLILYMNPLQLFFLDFQLSFALTFGLAWINHLYRPN